MWNKIKQWWKSSCFSWQDYAEKLPSPQRLQPVRTITEKELAQRFLAAPGSPLWEATLAVIDQHILANMDEAMTISMSDRDQRWHLAAADALTALRDNLREREQAAREEKESLKAQ